MAVARVAIGATTTGTTATIAVAYPAGVAAGQVAILFTESGNGADPAAPTGFTHQGSVGVGSSGTDVGATKFSVFTRILDGSESGSVTVNMVNGHVVGKMVTYSGADATTPVTLSAGETQTPASTTQSTGPIASKTSDGNDIFISIAGHDRDSATQSAYTSAVWNNITGASNSLIQTSYNGGGGGGICGQELVPSANSTGAVSGSGTITSSVWAGFMVRVNASGSMGGGGTTYSDTISEGLTSSASLANAATFPNAWSATVTAAYSVAAGSVFNESVSEGLTASDARSVAATFTNALSEALAGSYGLSAGTLFALSLTESVTAGESLASIGQFTDVLTELLAASDGFVVAGGAVHIEPNISYRRRRAKTVDYGTPILRR